MKVKKDGIIRNIDEKRLREYLAKGYAPVTKESGTKTPDADAGEKPINQMNTEQLKQKAAELGVDISATTTNKQRATIILEAIKAKEGTSLAAEGGKSITEESGAKE